MFSRTPTPPAFCPCAGLRIYVQLKPANIIRALRPLYCDNGSRSMHWLWTLFVPVMAILTVAAGFVLIIVSTLNWFVWSGTLVASVFMLKSSCDPQSAFLNGLAVTFVSSIDNLVTEFICRMVDPGEVNDAPAIQTTRKGIAYYRVIMLLYGVFAFISGPLIFILGDYTWAK